MWRVRLWIRVAGVCVVLAVGRQVVVVGQVGRGQIPPRPGARAYTVAAEQLPAALALPAIASVIVGVNDTLWHPFDAAMIGRALAHTVGALHDAGALVLTRAGIVQLADGNLIPPLAGYLASELPPGRLDLLAGERC